MAANTEVTITYNVKLDIADRDAIVALMEADHLRASTTTGGGDWGAKLTNSATATPAAGTPATAAAERTVVGGHSDGVWGPGWSISTKSVDVGTVERTTWSDDEDETLDAAVPVKYTVTADLRQWDSTTYPNRYDLEADAILVDTLPSGIVWNQTSPSFITVTDHNNNPITLTATAAGSDGHAAVDAAGQFSYARGHHPGGR